MIIQLAIGLGLAIGVATYDGKTIKPNPTTSIRPKTMRWPMLSPSTPAEFEWTQFGQDMKGLQYSEHFGDHVAISRSSTCIAIGSPGSFFSDSAGDIIGVYITLSGDGNRVAVGAQHYNNGIGYAKVFELYSGSWESLGQSLLWDQVGSNFGCSVALSENGNVLGVGANKYGFNGPERDFLECSIIQMVLGLK
eukprot:3773809-Ditylum_brightwellii.AAC.2